LNEILTRFWDEEGILGGRGGLSNETVSFERHFFLNYLQNFTEGLDRSVAEIQRDFSTVLHAAEEMSDATYWTELYEEEFAANVTVQTPKPS